MLFFSSKVHSIVYMIRIRIFGARRINSETFSGRHGIGRRDILLSVNKLVRLNEMDQKACDKRLNRLISCIHHTCEYKQYCHVGANNAGWDCFKTLILREILRIQNLLLVEHCVFVEVIHLFQSVGCVRNKLRLDGIPALDLWDLIVAVLGNMNQSDKAR